MKLKSLFCLGILTFLSLTGCKKQTPEHVHSYDKENIEWVWSETSTGGYTAKAIISCTSCDESKEGHSIEVDATMTNAQTKAPTCSTPGTTTYTASISFEGESYSATKEKAVTDSNAHHYIDVVDSSYLKSAATCTEDAIYYKSCEFCHEKSEETFTALNTKLGHHMIHHAATSATCQVEGNIEYYECDRCHILYLEEAGTTEVTQNDVVIPTAHHYIEVQDNAYLKSPATCTEEITYYKSCEYCHELSSETFTVPNTKLGHQMVHQTATTSTCQEHGHIEHYECERCHKYFADEQGATELSENDVILPLSHNMTHHAEVPATCTTDGTAEYYTCSYEPGVLYKDEAGTQTFANASELVIEKLGHQFNESLNCVEGDTTLKEEYGMEDASALDSMVPMTISDLGLTSGGQLPLDGNHLFGTCDYPANGGIDLWFQFDYSVVNVDSYYWFYLFNQFDEGGIVCRLQLNRQEDDGRIKAYIYSQNDYSANPGTTVVHTAGAVGTNFWFPYPCGVKSSTTNLAHVTARCLDPDTNLYRCTFTIGVEGGTQYYPVASASDVPGSKADNETTNPECHFDICLGSSYFNSNNGRKFRFSCTSNSQPVTITDHASEDKMIVYKDASGNLYGKINNPGTAKIPTLEGTNKAFIGWFDGSGNRVKDGDPINSKVVVTPRFVSNTTNMFTLSDFGFDTKDKWLARASGSHENTGTQGVYATSGSSLDVYFIYQVTGRYDGDNYVIMGFPYDTVDGKTRIYFRLNENNNTNLNGYIYDGGSGIGTLGPAGADGTYFDSGSGFKANRNIPLLIHVTVTDNGNNNVTLTLEITNLVTGSVFSTSNSTTFKMENPSEPTTYGVDYEHRHRNIFGFNNNLVTDTRVTDAF